METIELIQIQTKIDDLRKTIESMVESKKIQPVPCRSSEIKDLAVSLAKAQSEMSVANLNKGNPYFKSRYADLMSIVEASRPCLTKHGLSVTQQLIDDHEGMSWLVTTLWHVSGQWIETRKRVVPAKTDIQTISSHTTYLKRMCYASLIGVVTGDEDDDGEMAVAPSRDTFAKGTALNTKYNPREESPETITKEQREELEYELAEYPDIAEMVIGGLKIQSIADMPKSKFLPSVSRIREIKALRNGNK